MDSPLYDALCAQKRHAQSGWTEPAATTLPAPAALVSELDACAFFADGTRQGALVPLADFTRHRIAKALRDAAQTIARLEQNIVAQVDAGVVIVAKERARQIQVEGYSPAGDRGRARELMAAAQCYLLAAVLGRHAGTDPNGQFAPPPGWPWETRFWKPSANLIRNLAKAGALVAAAIDAIRAET